MSLCLVVLFGYVINLDLKSSGPMHHFWSRTMVNPRLTPQERVNARGMRSGRHGLRDEDKRASYPTGDRR